MRVFSFFVPDILDQRSGHSLAFIVWPSMTQRFPSECEHHLTWGGPGGPDLFYSPSIWSTCVGGRKSLIELLYLFGKVRRELHKKHTYIFYSSVFRRERGDGGRSVSGRHSRRRTCGWTRCFQVAEETGKLSVSPCFHIQIQGFLKNHSSPARARYTRRSSQIMSVC